MFYEFSSFPPMSRKRCFFSLSFLNLTALTPTMLHLFYESNPVRFYAANIFYPFDGEGLPFFEFTTVH